MSTDTFSANPSKPEKSRGNAVDVNGLPAVIKEEFTRACAHLQASQSRVLLSLVCDFIASTQEKIGDLFNTPTFDESLVLKAVNTGACRIDEIARKSRLSEAKATAAAEHLVRRRLLRKAKQEGKGPAVWLYLPK